MAKSKKSTKQDNKPVFPYINPTGKGGFQDHPELINPGGRPKNRESFAWWYGEFKDMSVAELRVWLENNPEDDRSVASDLAFTRVWNAKKDLKEFQEVADRSEGKAEQAFKADVAVTTEQKISPQQMKAIGEGILQVFKENYALPPPSPAD